MGDWGGLGSWVLVGSLVVGAVCMPPAIVRCLILSERRGCVCAAGERGGVCGGLSGVLAKPSRTGSLLVCVLVGACVVVAGADGLGGAGAGGAVVNGVVGGAWFVGSGANARNRLLISSEMSPARTHESCFGEYPSQRTRNSDSPSLDLRSSRSFRTPNVFSGMSKFW